MGPDDFDYHLPPEAVAQVPAEPRPSARMLVSLDDGPPAHLTVADLPSLVQPGDLMVVNDSRVMPARLSLRKPTGGVAEVLLLEAVDGDGRAWEALVRPGRRLAPGTRLESGTGVTVVVGDRLEGGRRRVEVDGDVEGHGQIPLPPYIRVPLADSGRYQTVYADRPGSVAAPTAGLHLTHAVLEACRRAGAEVATVDLAVGLDTFRPLEGPALDDHTMHSERYRVPAGTMAACRRARRVVAVGTTTVRALESAAVTGTLEGRTDLFIRDGFRFEVVDVLLSNFHLPRSSLLVMLQAFTGPRWRRLYEIALAEGYRFLSFGDAMLVGRG